MRTTSDLCRGATDHLTILADWLPCIHAPQCEFVASWDGIDQVDRYTLQLDVFAGREIAQRDRHVIARADAIAGRQRGGSAVHGR